MKKYLLLLIISLAEFCFISSQTVSGKLVNQIGEGLPNLQMQMYIATHIYNTTSGFDGSFTFTNVSGVSDSYLPDGYSISNNFPNPFNPLTRINVTLPKEGKVKVNLYNIMGERVRNEIEKDFSAGENYIDLELNGLANGFYLAKITIDDFYTVTKKLTLLYGSQHLSAANATTNSRFNKTSLDAQIDSIVVTVTAAIKRTITNLPMYTGGNLYLGNLSISLVSSLSGKVAYAGTTIPVSGVSVTVDNQSSTTGSNGNYQLNNLVAGSRNLTATKNGFDPYYNTIELLVGSNTHGIEMTSSTYTGLLNGIIKSASSLSPLENVLVTVLNNDSTPSQLQASSDVTGYYQVPSVPQGQRLIKFQKQNYATKTVTIFMSGTNYPYNTNLANKPGIPSDPTPSDNATGQPRSLTLSWACVDPNGDPLTYDVYFGTSNPPTQVVSSNQTSTTLERTNLSYNTIYYWKVKARDSYNNSTEGPVWKLTIKISACDGITQVNYSGGPYNTVGIGDQCWLTKNLNIGQMIPGSQLPSNPSLIEKYCYSNDTTNCTTYGGLYTWNEAMQNVTTPGAQGICPSGWHIPTYAQLQTLSGAVGGNGNALKREDQGSGSGQGTNTSGFSALLAGYRYYGGNFYDLGYYAYFWSSTEYDATYAYYMGLSDTDGGIYLTSSYKGFGFSVRCLKD